MEIVWCTAFNSYTDVLNNSVTVGEFQVFDG